MAKELNTAELGDTGLRRVLRLNLQDRCDITEIEAGRDWMEVKDSCEEYHQYRFEIELINEADDFSIPDDN